MVIYVTNEILKEKITNYKGHKCKDHGNNPHNLCLTVIVPQVLHRPPNTEGRQKYAFGIQPSLTCDSYRRRRRPQIIPTIIAIIITRSYLYVTLGALAIHNSLYPIAAHFRHPFMYSYVSFIKLHVAYSSGVRRNLLPYGRLYALSKCGTRIPLS